MMKHHHEIELKGETFLLLPQKAVYRPRKQQLILSDLHIGKASHFRKQGLAMPPQSHLKDIDTLHFLMDHWQPASVLFLGDLFHSIYNNEWLWLKSFMMTYPKTQFILVEGNHDILKEDLYQDLPNLIKLEILEEEHFVFSHEPIDKPLKLNFCGHLHPGLRITGIARQSEKLPCFFHSRTHFILPAFGHLTGLYLLEQEKDALYYLVAGSKIIRHSY